MVILTMVIIGRLQRIAMMNMLINVRTEWISAEALLLEAKSHLVFMQVCTSNCNSMD